MPPLSKKDPQNFQQTFLCVIVLLVIIVIRKSLALSSMPDHFCLIPMNSSAPFVFYFYFFIVVRFCKFLSFSLVSRQKLVIVTDATALLPRAILASPSQRLHRLVICLRERRILVKCIIMKKKQKKRRKILLFIKFYSSVDWIRILNELKMK